MDRHSAFIQQGYIREIITVIEQLTDISPAVLSALKAELLRHQHHQGPLSIGEANYFLDLAYEQLALPHLGLLVGTRWSLMCHGLASMAAMTQETYGDSLATATRLCDQLFPAITMELIAKKDVLELKIIENVSLAPHGRFYIEAIQSNFYNILHYLLGSEVEPAYLGFAYNAPSYDHYYKRVFRCPIRFDAENIFAVSLKTARMPLKLANIHAAKLAEKTFIESQPVISKNNLIRDLRKLFQQATALPDLASAAQSLDMNARTLHRRLQSLGTNYLNEVELFRKERACELLNTTRRPITDIALQLGYFDSSAFCKAFKKWTGESPRSYQKKSLAG